MRKPLLRRLLIACVLLIVVAALAMRWAEGAAPQTVRLPDGTTLSLESWDYGRHHGLRRQGNRWWQKLLPSKEVCGFDTADPVLVLWLRKRSSVTPTSPPTNPNASWWDWAEIVDEQGRGVRTWLGGTSSPHNEGLVERVETISSTDRPQPYDFPSTQPLGYDGECLLLPVFPRRGNEIHIRFHSLRAALPVAEIQLSNPTPGPHPVWKPEPLPILRQDGDLKFSLHAVKNQIRIDVPDSTYRMAPFDPIRDFARPMNVNEWKTLTTRYTVTDHGLPTRDWQPRLMMLSDASGNRLDLPAAFSPVGMYMKNSEPTLDMAGLFCTGEVAHRLRVEFVRSPFAHFGPEDLWTVRNIAVPSRRGITPSLAKCKREGATFELLGLAGQDYPCRPMGKWLETVSAPTLNVRVSPARNDMQLYLRATDEKGRPIGYTEMGLAGVVYSWQPPDLFQMFPPDSHRSTFVANRTLYTALAQPIDNVVNFNLTIPSGVKRINLTFAISRSRWVEFTPDLFHP